MAGYFKAWAGKARDSAEALLRSQQISIVLYAYGIGGGLAALGIEAGRLGLKKARVVSPDSYGFGAAFGKNLARTFVRLGPTFIKLGQILASRPDLVGEPVAEELKVLFDRVPPIAFKIIQKIMSSELGKEKIKKRFSLIEPEPVASASISQAHSAKLDDGTEVIVKVQKPGVQRMVRVDLRIIGGIVRSLNILYPKAQLLQLFEDFQEGTLREIDYRLEAKNIDRFQKNYRSFFSDSEVLFPSYYPEFLSERVIVLQPMQGVRVSDLKKGSTVARRVAAKGLAAVLEQIFDHGFFHADPHAGNLFFVEDSGRLGFIDLGLVGQLNSKDKKKFLKVIMAILKRERDSLARALFDLGVSGKKTDYNQFEKSIQDLLDEVKLKGVGNLRIDEMVSRLFLIARDNNVHIPNRYVLMMRSCLVIEGVAKSLDPNISLFKVATPIVAKSLMKSYNPLRFLGKWL